MVAEADIIESCVLFMVLGFVSGFGIFFSSGLFAWTVFKRSLDT